ncbi:MAG: hypothetical protein ACYDBQ_08960 [Thermoplasmatota archaeon]
MDVEARLLAGWVREHGHDVIGAEAGPGSPANLACLQDAAGAWDADWLVVDGPTCVPAVLDGFDAPRTKLLVVDDAGFGSTASAALVLNPNIGATAELYPGVPSDRLLLGTSYCLLREDLLAEPKATEGAVHRPDRLLVTFGGSDPTGATLRLLTSLSRSQVNWKITVVLGPLNGQEVLPDAFRGQIREVVKAPTDMARRLANTDAAVICAGGTLWELLYFRRVVFSFHANPIQELVVGRLARQGLVIDMGPVTDAGSARAAALLEDQSLFRRTKAAVQRLGEEVVDGAGVSRVVDKMSTLPMDAQGDVLPSRHAHGAPFR